MFRENRIMKNIAIIVIGILLFSFYTYRYNKTELANFKFAKDVKVIDFSGAIKKQCTLNKLSSRVEAIEQLLNKNNQGWEKSFVSFAVEIILVGKEQELHIAGNVILIVDKERKQPTIVKGFDSQTMNESFGNLCNAMQINESYNEG